MSIKVGEYQWRIVRGAKSATYTVQSRRYSCTKNGWWKTFFNGQRYTYEWLAPQEEYEHKQATIQRNFNKRMSPEDLHYYNLGTPPMWARVSFDTIEEAQLWIDKKIKQQALDNSYRGGWQP